MANDFDPKREIFVTNCSLFETFIRRDMNLGYSDREMVAVFMNILKELFSRQDDPESARKQFVDRLMEKD